MSRIRKAYETRLRWLLQQLRSRRLDHGVQWLMNKAERLSATDRISLAEALARVAQQLQAKTAFTRPCAPPPRDVHFFCDAGLGGLARWLRAAGYDAAWETGINDDVLLQKAQESGAILLTTDSMLMERRLLRDRIIPSLWLPPILGIPEQLALVFREFALTARLPRCMTCGGELLRKGQRKPARAHPAKNLSLAG